MSRRPMLLGFGVAILILLVLYAVVVFGLMLLSGKEANPLGKSAVGVIDINGIIMSSRTIIEELQRFQDSDRIKAIVLRIDSPGGAVGPAQEIYEEIKKINATKKVVSSFGNTAASGAYYIACASEKIVSNPGTLTGSIGVIMEFINAQGLYEMIGISNTSIKSGEFKDTGTSTRALTAREKKLLQEVIDAVYEQFVSAIVDGRKLERNDVYLVADGRILSGEQARNLNLVDELGNFQDALDLAAKLGGIKGKPEVVFSKPKHVSYIDYVLDHLGESIGKIINKNVQPSGSLQLMLK